jgi:hypothetical protein
MNKKYTKELKADIIINMDMLGWEQDGKGLDFINVSGNGERKHFGSWKALHRFMIDTTGI